MAPLPMPMSRAWVEEKGSRAEQSLLDATGKCVWPWHGACLGIAQTGAAAAQGLGGAGGAPLLAEALRPVEAVATLGRQPTRKKKTRT